MPLINLISLEFPIHSLIHSALGIPCQLCARSQAESPVARSWIRTLPTSALRDGPHIQ